jgi:predicted nucleic acid-binding protein
VSVFDASVFVNALLGVGPAGDRARAELRDQTVLEVPALFRAEVMAALRAAVHRGTLSRIRAAAGVRELQRLRTAEYPFRPFTQRVWELRENVTVYDAWYVALAELLGTDLVTADDRLANADGPRCRVRRVGV